MFNIQIHKEMTHSNFYSQIQAIKLVERQELYEAVRLHGGSYTWDKECRPIIAVNIDSGPIDVMICAVEIERESDTLKLHGIDNEWGEIVKFDISEVFAGHLAYVIDRIPAVKGTEDVSSTPTNKMKAK